MRRCLSVCDYTKSHYRIIHKEKLLAKNSFDLEVKGHMGQGQIRVPYKGRWAHDNVKLLHCIIE